MQEITSLTDLQRILPRKSRPSGLVPLTFDLHDGHLSLLQRARMECATVVASLFSRIRYGPRHERVRWPQSPARDRALLSAQKGVDLLFCCGEFPPPCGESWAKVGPLGHRWEGLRYPELFPAAATVLRNLLAAGSFDRLYLGAKDYQQLLILRALARTVRPGIEVVDCPTVREHDGLAVSASNSNLSPDLRARAATMWLALSQAQELVAAGERRAATVQAVMLDELRAGGLTPDYAVVVNSQTLLPIARLEHPARAVIAAYIGHHRGNLWRCCGPGVERRKLVRLTDNVALEPKAACAPRASAGL
jgi:pantoate--beta-alanine ligase